MLQMFYDRFLALCNANNVKPTAVADAVGLSRMNASRWKKGTIPSSTNLQKLADYFNVPIGYLMGTNDSIAKSVTQSDTQRTIANAEIEKNKIYLRNLINNIDTVAEENKIKAIQEITAFAQYTLDKYKQPQNP